MIGRWLRGWGLRAEVARLLIAIEREPGARAKQAATRYLDSIELQIAKAEELSPGDSAAVVGVMIQLAAGVSGRLSTEKAIPREEKLSLQLAAIYLQARIDRNRGVISRRAADRVLSAINNSLNQRGKLA